MMGWYDGSWGPGGGWFVMMAGMVLFWGLVVFALVSLLRSGGGSTGGSGAESGADPRSRAEAILDERLARGEIDAEEYRARRQVLHGG